MTNIILFTLIAIGLIWLIYGIDRWCRLPRPSHLNIVTLNTIAILTSAALVAGIQFVRMAINQ